ncbi:hypothetical protein LIA77_07812 [Sarocladium implicatum]|nr:hypothetical protein LIA77_07812 [Sarocladium implicatum]
MRELQQIVPFLKGAPPRIQPQPQDKPLVFPYSPEDERAIESLESRSGPHESTSPTEMAQRLLSALIPEEAAETTPPLCQGILNTVLAMAAAVHADSHMHHALLRVCASLGRREGYWNGLPSLTGKRSFLDPRTENSHCDICRPGRSFRFDGRLVNIDAAACRMMTKCLRTIPMHTFNEDSIARWIHDVRCACTWLTECGTDLRAYLLAAQADGHAKVTLNIDSRKELPCEHSCIWILCPTCRKDIDAGLTNWDNWKRRLRQYQGYEKVPDAWDGKGLIRQGAFLVVKTAVTRTLEVMEAADGILKVT